MWRAFFTATSVTIICVAPAPATYAQWVTFSDETSWRLYAPELVSNTDEKSFAWGDLDLDGDTDLVVARKQLANSGGKRTNVLLLNENGALRDRTAAFATASDVPGDHGFLTPTSNRDVTLADVDGDGWLDIVTAATFSHGDPKHIGHPRIYRNLGCAGPCSPAHGWLGFRYEDARIPPLLSWYGQSGNNPCFNEVNAGDVTGDGYPDLWLTDSSFCAATDFNSRLLINRGASQPGYFVDETHSRFATDFPVTENGVSGIIADFTGDGLRDIVNQEEGDNVSIAYNTPSGYFVGDQTVFGPSTYFVSAAELNGDGKLDLIVTQGAMDRYVLNMGNAPDGSATFLSYQFTYAHSGTGLAATDEGPGGDNLGADLDGDGRTDVLIAAVEFSTAQCDLRLHIYRNLGGPPGGPINLQEQTTGSGCALFNNNPPTCIVAGIPASQLTGVQSVAVLHIDGDDQLDMVVGRCSGTQVYINQLPCANPDCDGDGVAGTADNCEDIPNPNQQNQDHDPWGDACDNCPNAAGGLADTDTDSFGDLCDNCQGAPNFSETVAGFPTIRAVSQEGFCWSGALDLWWVRGALSEVEVYSFTTLTPSPASSCFADLASPAPGTGFWYLARANCPGASWQSSLGAEPERDLVLP